MGEIIVNLRATPLLLAAALILSCVRALAAAPPAPTTLNPEWGVVFPDQKALELVHQCSRRAPGPISGTWTPSAQQIADLDDALLPALMVQFVQRELSDKGWQPTDYYRQYGGLIIRGQRIIYVNAFNRYVVEHSKPIDAWKTKAVAICDGGELVFGVEYDPESKTLSEIQFNGKP